MQRKGRFELADRGPLLTIGDISLELQQVAAGCAGAGVRTSRCTKTIQVDGWRPIATWGHDSGGEVPRDLSIDSTSSHRDPTLRERREDIPLLVNYFVSKLSQRMRKRITSVSRQTMEVLTNHSWRGNVRELANFIERAVILTRGEELEVPVNELATSSETIVAVGTPSTFRQAESSVIVNALRACSGRIAGKGGAAERLGLKRTTLQNKIRRLGIAKATYGD
jgi:transcriptional regulator with GAF, ATPase, and Fis domain